MVIGTVPGEIAWWASLPLGSSTLTDDHLHSDPPTAAQLAAARREVADALWSLAPPQPAMTVAVGGSATSLARMAGSILDAAALLRSLRVLASEPSTSVARRTRSTPSGRACCPPGC